jgi:hypothetical protein
MAQPLVVLGNDLTMAGADWAAPRASWISDPEAAGAPADRHSAGRNRIVLHPAMQIFQRCSPVLGHGLCGSESPWAPPANFAFGRADRDIAILR